MERLTDNINKFLPYGETLKAILVHKSLTKNDLRKLLRLKGVFLDSAEDETTFPLLTTSLLTPSQFDFIKDKLKSKEDRPKIITRPIEWQSTEKLINAVPEDIKLKELVQDNFSRYNVISTTNFAPVDGNLDKLKMEFKCETTSYNDSWYRTKNEFAGEVLIERIEREGKVELQMTYTSPETLDIADKVVKKLISHFKENRHIDRTKETEKITYGTFSNESRVYFLMSLTNNTSTFEFEKITDLEIGPDNNMDLPDDFEMIKAGAIKQLYIQGDTLHQSVFLRENKNHKYLELAGVEVQYKFKTHAAEGVCKIWFGFENYLKKRTANIEFSLNLVSLSLGENYTHVNKNSIWTNLLQEFEKVKSQKFKEYKATNTSNS